MKLKYLVFLLCLSSSNAWAVDEPVEHQITKFYDSVEFSGWSVVELIIRNKKSFLTEIVVFCQLKNANGYTWTGKSSVRNIKSGERRTIKVSNEGDTEYFYLPTSAKCRVRYPSEGHFTFVD